MSAKSDLREADQIEGVPLPEERQAVYGHQSFLTGFSDFVEAGRVPSALLLHGPHGIGKATIAFECARRLLTATSDEPAGRIAEQIAQGSHPNVFVLRRVMNKTGSNFATRILIDQISQRQNSGADPLIARLHRTRGRSGYRVCIVDSIDDCNLSAANALLKILEEPPAETLFILVSHRPGQLLPTIRSRCHAHALRLLTDDDIAKVIASAPAGDRESVSEAIALAAGRPRRAYEILVHGGMELLQRLRTWLADPVGGANGAQLALADAIAGAGDAEKRFARDLILEHLATEARRQAVSGSGKRMRLASATELWEKAQAMFAEAETYNLDARQTLVTIFDAYLAHARATSPVPADFQ